VIKHIIKLFHRGEIHIVIDYTVAKFRRRQVLFIGALEQVR